MTVLVKIKEGDFGTTYQFTIEDVDYTSYTITLHVWKGSTKIVDGGTCTSILNGSDTVVSHVTIDGESDTPGEYNGELKFVGAGFEEKTKTFTWKVLNAAEA